MADAPSDSSDSPSTEPLVALSGVNKWFGDLHVLQDINLDIARGEVVVVIGPSGSGKSTLCRAINRLEPVDKGEIRLDGTLLPEEGKALAQLRAEVGMVFQSFNLFAHKTVLDNVTLGPIKVRGRSASSARDEAKQLLERVDVLTTDGAILLGYAAENPDELEVVGEPFSEERYGIGYELGDTEMCEFITTTIQDAMDDGLWADAFEATLGQSGVETPEPPEMDECL